ncbi:MAG: RDD family protein [Pseudobdellovibrionaceae bacterium]|nr:RDD family protein [Pseudobdellovibrionaceae bacterium]
MNQSNAWQPESQKLATGSRRFHAFLVDGFLCAGLVMSLFHMMNQMVSLMDLPGARLVLILIGIMGYESVQVGLWGCTLGHRLFGLRVITQDGRKPGFKLAFIRWLSKGFHGLRGLRPLNAGLGPATHDVATQTSVISVR